MLKTIHSREQFESVLKEEGAVLAYYSTVACNVCKVLKPKVDEYFTANFPRMHLCYIDSEQTPDIAAQQRVLVAPTVVIYFEGREFFRFSRAFGLEEMAGKVERPYSLMFGD